MRTPMVLALTLFIAACGGSSAAPSPAATGAITTAAPSASSASSQPTSPPQTSPPRPQPSSDDQVHGVQATLASCSGNALYTASPISVDKISYILPLGNFTPLPSDHLYFVITRGGVTTDNTPTETVDLFSPGDITVFQIGRQTKTTNGEIVNTDYFMSFAACREVGGLFGHVSSFTGRLGAIDYANCEAPYSIGDESEYQHCTADVNITLQAGEKIGTAGGKWSAALDVSTEDVRLPDPYVANPAHHYDMKAACVVDYYTGDLRASLQMLLGHGGDGKHVADGCGQPFQDKQATLQGNWFRGTPEETSNDIGRLLALGHNNVDPDVGVISIGGTLDQRGEWQFAPTHSGNVNREFSEVTPGDALYCYQAHGKSGRILIQLVTESTIKIEKQSGACAATLAFNQPFDYQR